MKSKSKSNSKPKFKEALLTENNSVVPILPKQYAYDDLQSLITSNKHGCICRKKPTYTSDTQVFIDDHMYSLFDHMNELKERYYFEGYMVDMKYDHLLDIVQQCLHVEYIDNDQSEDECDDEYDDHTIKSEPL